MSIRTAPKAARLTWNGLSKLPVPPVVRAGAGHYEVQICRDGIEDLPAPLNAATCWIYCREAWPHVDPDYEGDIFITLTVEGDHSYCQLLPNHKHTRLGVFPGLLFTTDPMSLHWLAPNADTGLNFIGLQFEVPYHKVDEFYRDLLRQLTTLGTVRDLSPACTDALLTATSEYVGSPPGPLV